MTSDTQRAESQAQRLQTAIAQMTALVRQPANLQRLRARPGADEWNVLETLGHCAEMIPYWIAQSRMLIAASGPDLPRFGRTLDAESRLAGPASGDTTEPEMLAAHLENETHSAAAAIRAFSAAERAKRGVSVRGEELTVEEIIARNMVGHAETHLEQVRHALSS